MLVVQPLSVAEAEMVDALACGARDRGFDFPPSPQFMCEYGVMVAALVLGTSDFGRGGSSPSTRTSFKRSDSE